MPEIDAARWLTLAAARRSMLRSQRPFLDRLEAMAAGTGAAPPSL